MMRADLGVRPENVLVMQIALSREAYKEESQRRDFFARLLRRVEGLPDVSEAGAVNYVPISGSGNNNMTFQIVGEAAFSKGREPHVEHRVATPGYFNAHSTARPRGRAFP